MSSEQRTPHFCQIDGCSGVVKARGWCNAHYHRFRRYGEPVGAYKEHGLKGTRRNLDRAQVPPEMDRITAEQVAWVAGLFEGEGSIFVGSRKNGPREYATPVATLNSTDRDVIERLREIVGGAVNMERRRQPHWKDQWKWRLQGYQPIARFVALVMPWLGERRRGQCQEVMERCEAVRRSVS